MLIAALLALAPALSQKAAPPEELQAIVAVSIDPGFEDAWNHTRSAEGFKLSSVGRVVRGQGFRVCVFMTGYAVGPKGHVDSNYDLKITRPDGTTFFEHRGIGLCVEDGMQKGHVELARVALDLALAAPEPLGTYKITVEIHDQVAKASASAEDSLALSEYPDPRPFQSRKELEAWMLGYTRFPQPTRLLDAVASAAAVELFGGEPPNHALRGFLATVCHDNAFLEALLLERFPKLDHAARLAALELLVATPYEAKPFLAAASEEERSAAQRLPAARPDPLEGAIRDAGQIDELWGSFFASGRFAPIERLAKALSLDEQLDGREKDPGTIALEEAVRKSLKSNLRMPRVRPYSEWLLENGRLEARDAERLKELLQP